MGGVQSADEKEAIRIRNVALSEAKILLSGESESLPLTRKCLGDEGVMQLAELLKAQNNVKFLHLDGNFIGVEGVSKVVESLEESLTLLVLDMDHNILGDEGALKMAALLRVSPCMRELSLQFNEISTTGCRGLADALESNTMLRTLSLGGNPFGDDGAAHVARALEMNTGLRELSLGSAGLGDNAAERLAEALQQNTTLTNLNLEHNLIGDAGAIALARIVAINVGSGTGQATGLAELHLFANKVGDDGARCIADALETNGNMRGLSLTINVPDSANKSEEARDSLRRSHTVRRAMVAVTNGDPIMDLEGKNIGDVGASRLAEAIEGATTLTELRLENSEIGDAGAFRLAEALEHTRSPLELVLLRGNSFSETGANRLAAAVKRCNSGLDRGITVDFDMDNVPPPVPNPGDMALPEPTLSYTEMPHGDFPVEFPHLDGLAVSEAVLSFAGMPQGDEAVEVTNPGYSVTTEESQSSKAILQGDDAVEGEWVVDDDEPVEALPGTDVVASTFSNSQRVHEEPVDHSFAAEAYDLGGDGPEAYDEHMYDDPNPEDMRFPEGSSAPALMGSALIGDQASAGGISSHWRAGVTGTDVHVGIDSRRELRI